MEGIVEQFGSAWAVCEPDFHFPTDAEASLWRWRREASVKAGRLVVVAVVLC